MASNRDDLPLDIEAALMEGAQMEHDFYRVRPEDKTMNDKTLEEMSLTELLDALRDNKRETKQIEETGNYMRQWVLEIACGHLLNQIERVIELEVESE